MAVLSRIEASFSSVETRAVVQQIEAEMAAVHVQSLDGGGEIAGE